MTTTADRLAGFCAHLAEFEIPETAWVHEGAAMSAPRVTVQLTCHEPSMIAPALLAWADTLTEATAKAWRFPQGDSVHLSVTGLLPGGVSVLVYGGLWGPSHGFGADLPRDATTTIPLPMLWHAANLKEARA